ncbi:MAG: electron transport complex subunit RsxG, partial [Thiomicrorhabdus sp.]|nr:electron transport complex subunit RsxG [Thiomicrorhabdus sp.]
SLVVFTENKTRDQIIENERQALLSALNELVDSKRYDNDLLTDTILLTATDKLGTKETTKVYRARKNNKPVAAVFTSIAPNGYNGEIKLLVGINYDGSLAGVRVINHKETPGLGDKIEERKDDWILSFNGRTLHTNTTNQQVIANDPRWAVKKDGGEFDQFTGATITPRAVISAVKNALLFVHQRGESLYE